MDEDDLTTGKHAGATFVPTDADRKRVQNASGLGIPNRMVAQFVINPETGRPITEKTLVKHFAKEIELGLALKSEAIAQTMGQIATDPDHPKAVTAGIFWAKCKMGWREADKVEAPTGPAPQVVIQVASEEEGIRMRDRLGADSARIEEAP